MSNDDACPRGYHRQLGRISRARLEIEDHGILTVHLAFAFGGTCQSLSSPALDAFDPARDRRVGTAGGLDFVLRLLAVFGARHLGELEGRSAYALRKGTEWGASVTGVQAPEFDGGRALTLDDWRTEWRAEFEACAARMERRT